MAKSKRSTRKEPTREEKQAWWERYCESVLREMKEERRKRERLSPEDQESFREILHRKRGDRAHCPGCGERFNRDNLYVCTKCGADYCFRCVWQLEEFGEEGDPRWRCSCGGEAL